ncbi:MAG: TetR/AcrR family transcriptional regulator [Terriglobales bacterium]|jgi:AcrR family transcriptional regulator
MCSLSATAPKARDPQAPQRNNGRLRVAAILKAAAALIDEKGFDGTTMAEIAERSGTKIGSLYRFFPNIESVADTLLDHGREFMTVAFDQFQAQVHTLSVDAFADQLMSLLCTLFARPGYKKLLDSGAEWSEKRKQLRASVLRRIIQCLMAHTPALTRESAKDIAVVVLLQAKAVATNQTLVASKSGISTEFRDLTRLYLQSRLRRS